MRMLSILAGSAVVLAMTSVVTAGAQQPDPAGGVVTGTVRDSLGAPLGSVRVTLVELEHTTLTDDDGTYRLAGVPAGVHSLHVRRIGYLFHLDSLRISGNEARRVDVVLDPRPMEIDEVVVRAQGVGLRGVVHDRELRPLTDAEIHLDLTSRVFRVGADGWFHATNLRPGKYMVRVVVPGYRTRLFSINVTPDEAREVAVLMEPGSRGTRYEIGWRDFARDRRWASAARTTRMVREDLDRLPTVRLADVAQLSSRAGPEPCLNVNGRLTYFPLEAYYVDEVEMVEVQLPGALPYSRPGAHRVRGNYTIHADMGYVSEPGGRRCTSYVQIWLRN